MLSPTLLLQGMFQFGLVSMCAWGVWKIVSSTSRGFATHAMGLIVLTTCAIAYYFPDSLGR